MSAAPTRAIRPQPAQERFLASPADIAIYGGAAGGGKSWALLLEPIRHRSNPEFGAVVFRRTHPQITAQGGLWDEAGKLYPPLGATANQGTLSYAFPSGARVKFAHLQHDKNVYDWQGSQIPLLCFDELTHFSESQFFYLLSRNRSLCGIRPYVRATCNPDADSWVARLLEWWIDPDTGLPVPERAGRVRWFVRLNDRLVWADSAEDLRGRYPDVQPKSLAFVPARLQDNQALMRADPGYLANLLALPLVERERLLGGNWRIRPSAGLVFNRGWFVLVEAAPAGLLAVRYWDKAATEDGGAWTCGVKMGKDCRTGLYYVLDVVRGQWSSLERDRVMRSTAQLDGPEVAVWCEQEPGSGGKESAEASVRLLAGSSVHTERVTGDKVTRAGPYSAQCEAGNVRLLRNPDRDWIAPYIDELHAFPAGKYADQVDASSGAFNKLAALFDGPYRATTDERALSAFHDTPAGVFAS